MKQLTKDGSETTINGTSDWVYEEELGVRDAFRWSPDGTHIAFWQFDSTGVGIFSLINDTDTQYPVVTKIPYPKAGTTNSAVRIGVVAADGGDVKWMKTPEDPRDSYLARLEWIDNDTVRCSSSIGCRTATTSCSAIARAATCDASSATSRRAGSRWSTTSSGSTTAKSFLWLSERDGWQHVFRVPRDGGEAKLVTPFDADATNVVGLDEKGGWLYFLASPDRATDRYLYRSRLDGSGTPERVTPQDQPGSHSYDMAPGGHLAFHTYSRFDMPPATDVVDLNGHQSLRKLTDTTALTAKLAPLLTPPVEFFTLDIGGGITLDGWMLKPLDLRRVAPLSGDRARLRRAGQPDGDRSLGRRPDALPPRARRSRLRDRQLRQPRHAGAEGRCVAERDLRHRRRSLVEGAGRGHPRAGRTLFVRRQLPASACGAGAAAARTRSTRCSAFPTSSTSASRSRRCPISGSTTRSTRNATWARRRTTPRATSIGSPINFAEGLKGKLLIVHGSGDDNVHYQGTERLVNRLVALGKPFDLMVYPNRTHAISEGPGTTPHVYRLIARYFLENLSRGAQIGRSLAREGARALRPRGGRTLR